MQYLRINISETCRSYLGVLLFFLNFSIMVIAHANGAMGLFVKQEASSFGNFLAFYNTNSLFKLLLCLSLLFLVFHLIGAKICYDSAFYETRERFHSVLFYWLLAGCALVPLTVAAIIVLTAHQSMVVHGIALGFRQAMKKYKIDTPMREYINRLQIENQCCGATSISDWFKVSWVDTSNAAPINRLANSHYMEANGEFLPRWAPFSCCRQDFIGAPCESVSLFFRPKKNEDWVKKSKIYSIDYLSEYEKYAAIFKRVASALKKPPQDIVRRGQAIVQSRHANFDTFLREVTGHSDVTPPPPATSNQRSPPANGRMDAARAIFEAQGVRAHSFPPELFRHLGKPPWRGRMVWSYDNITTAESDNLDQLLRTDGREEDSTMGLLRWRSFNQGGCAEPIGRMAQLAMRAAAFLFIYVLVAQILILVMTRYLQTSIDTAYRWGNPLLSAPGFLFNTSLPPRPDDYEALLQEGDEMLDSLAEDLDEDDFKVLLSPSWTPGESEDDTVSGSSVSSTALSSSSIISGEPTTDSGSGSASDADSELASDASALDTTEAPPEVKGAESAGDAEGAGDGGGGDEIDKGFPDGRTATAASRSRLSVKVSSSPVAAAMSANRASAMVLQSAGSRQIRQPADDDDQDSDDDEENIEASVASKGTLLKSDGSNSTSKISSNASTASPKKSSPQKSSPAKSSHHKSSPKKTKAKQSSSKKSSPRKSTPKNSSPKKSSQKKSSPKKSSPKKSSSKKASSKKTGQKKSSSKKSSPKKSKPKAKGKSTKSKKVQGHTTKRKKSPKGAKK
ncbi:uncharacterized protein LOC122365787 isoform X2 [Amphibalanus amphitrite]|uniref:uncharacterized protein LOC122365787 isoform X2 n=1 Tax=Amphibalanus amphitrite TaxID=1232801 RepID=UPI001C909A0C|nr:uncharacterized protein LOC122365787 isoform X2 [Amphibalanus amphitrite]